MMTRSTCRKTMTIHTTMDGHALIIGGKRYDCAVRVLTWHDHGIQFRAGEGFNKRRKKDIDLWVWHWSGGENPPDRMTETLRKEKLGIETAIYKGVIWQFCDPLLVDTADANYVNARSGGTEIVNYGFCGVPKSIPSAGKNRATYVCKLRSKKRRFAHFHTEDIAAALALADTLSFALKIPKTVPIFTDSAGNSLLISGTLTKKEMSFFSGHVGHFHINPEKDDPGLDLLEIFRVAWASEL